MQTGPEVKVLQSLIERLTNELRSKPFYFLNEHDVSGFLYNQLQTFQICQGSFNIVDRKGVKQACYKVHMEYPRYCLKSDNTVKTLGHYDLAVLREPKEDEPYFKNEEFIKKPVWIGFEVKLYRNTSEKGISQYILSEKNAFVKEKDRCVRKPADVGVILHLNIDKKAPIDTQKLRSLLNKELDEISDKTFLVYIESYRENKEPKMILKLLTDFIRDGA